MATARDLIISALRTARAIDPLETPDDQEIFLGLQELNGLLELWDSEELMPYASRNVSATLAPQTSYTISAASSSDIVSDRPIGIQAIHLLSNGTYVPMKQVFYDDYLSMSSPGTGSPNAWVYNPSFPAGEIILLPNPSDAVTIRVSYLVRTGDLVLDSVIELPPGYVPALQWDLARLLAPIFHIPDTQDIEREAIRRKGLIKRLNDKPKYLSSGTAPIGRRGRYFDFDRGI